LRPGGWGVPCGHGGGQEGNADKQVTFIHDKKGLYRLYLLNFLLLKLIQLLTGSPPTMDDQPLPMARTMVLTMIRWTGRTGIM
jgi:hypothetical protein